MTTALHVGAARRAITPPPHIDMAGYAARIGTADGILDDLYCRAIVFDDGDTSVVLAICDLLYITAPLRQQVCGLVHKRLGIPSDHIMITATHTHCGPAHLASASHSDLITELAEGIAAAICAAADRKQPAQLASGEVVVDGVTANRRRPDGPQDTTARLLVALRPSGHHEPIATLVNFACHPTILEHDTTSYSADFPAAMAATVETLCGGMSAFLQGCAGDINPVFTSHTVVDSQRAGTILGAACASRVLTLARLADTPRSINLSWAEETPISVPGRLVRPGPLDAELVEATVQPRQRPDPDQVAVQLSAVRDQIAAQPQHRRRYAPRAAELWIEDLLATHAAHFDSLDTPGTTLPVQLLRVGDDAAIVGLPGEPFTAISAHLREASGGTLLVAGYANHSAGYLPTADEFPQSGYEVGCSQYSAGTAERLIDTATALLKASREPRRWPSQPTKQAQ
jgi:hypothetical protein